MTETSDLSQLLSPYSARIAANKRFLTRLWNLDNDERPGFMIGYVGPKVIGGTTSENVLFVREGQGTFRDRLLDPESYLKTQVDVCLNMLANPGDFVPVISPMI